MVSSAEDNYGINYISANRFYVEMEERGQISASFTECSGLQAKLNYETRFEGGVNYQQRIIPGTVEFSEVTLKRGMINDLAFLGWTHGIFTQLKPENSRQINGYRRNVNILLFNQGGDIVQCWTLIGAIPVGWRISPLQAESSAVVIEELTLAYEGLQVDVTLNPQQTTANPQGGGATIHDKGRESENKGFFASN
ncbi:MAG TPA: phage tail protein [Cyanothece sp. UBA12306]|nr:phage tail protein [Cyanothece sp. UBA12306]